MTDTISRLRQTFPVETSILLNLFSLAILIVMALFLLTNMLLWWAKDKEYLKDETYKKASSFVAWAYVSLLVLATGTYAYIMIVLP